MPEIAQCIAKALPATHFTRLIRGVVLRDVAVVNMTFDMLWLVTFTLVGLIIAIERYAYLSLAKRSNREDFKKLHHMISGEDFNAAVKFASKSTSSMANMIGAGLIRLGRRQPREEIEYAMEEGLLDAMPRLEKRTQYLSTLANVSTLLGLLGTIIGLIAAFTAVASADPAQKASLLSQSIKLFKLVKFPIEGGTVVNEVPDILNVSKFFNLPIEDGIEITPFPRK